MDTAVRRKWNLNGAAATVLRVKGRLVVLKTWGRGTPLFRCKHAPRGYGAGRGLRAYRPGGDCVLAVTASAEASRRADGSSSRTAERLWVGRRGWFIVLVWALLHIYDIFRF